MKYLPCFYVFNNISKWREKEDIKNIMINYFKQLAWFMFTILLVGVLSINLLFDNLNNSKDFDSTQIKSIQQLQGDIDNF